MSPTETQAEIEIRLFLFTTVEAVHNLSQGFIAELFRPTFKPRGGCYIVT